MRTATAKIIKQAKQFGAQAVFKDKNYRVTSVTVASKKYEYMMVDNKRDFVGIYDEKATFDMILEDLEFFRSEPHWGSASEPKFTYVNDRKIL